MLMRAAMPGPLAERGRAKIPFENPVEPTIPVGPRLTATPCEILLGTKRNSNGPCPCNAHTRDQSLSWTRAAGKQKRGDICS
jgi:hypothetical protein